MKTTNKKNQVKYQILTLFLLVFFLFESFSVYSTEVSIPSGYEISQESKMEIENWMVDDTYWVDHIELFRLENDEDPELLLEYWMVDQKKWMLPYHKLLFFSGEEKLILEKWMTNEIFWN